MREARTHTHLLLHPIPDVSFLVMRANGTQHIRNIHIFYPDIDCQTHHTHEAKKHMNNEQEIPKI